DGESAGEADDGEQVPGGRGAAPGGEENRGGQAEQRGRLQRHVDREPHDIEGVHQRPSFLASSIRRVSRESSSSERSSRERSSKAAIAFSVEPSKKVSSTLRNADLLA